MPKYKLTKANLITKEPTTIPKSLANSLTVDLICKLVNIRYPNPSKVGRPIKHSIQECVEKIIQVLQTGQQWQSLGSGYSSYHKRFVKWSSDQIFSEAFYLLQKIPGLANSMGTCFYIDACVIRNKCGRDDISHCYKIKCKRSVKLTIIIGSNGLPVSLCLSKSSVHDVKFVRSALSKIKLRTRKIKTLVADKGYQSIKLRQELQQSGTNFLYHQRKNIKRPFVMNDKENHYLVNVTWSKELLIRY